MLPLVPAEPPRVAVSPNGALAAIHEASRVTVIALPTCEPFGVIAATDETTIGWLGARLLVVTGTKARLVDPIAPKVITEREVDAGLRVRASVGDYALLSNETTTVLLDGTLTPRPVRARTAPTLAGVGAGWFVVVDGDALREWDPATATPKRTWKAGGTVTAVGGNEHVVWRTTREAPHRIDVIQLVARGQPKQHELPEAIIAVAGDPRSDVLACRVASGLVYVIDLAGKEAPRALDTGTVTAADAIGLTLSFVVLAQWRMPTQCAPLAEPTWRNEIIAWTRSGIIDRYPRVPAIAALARQLELEEELLAAITLCYGAHLCGAPGVPPDALDEILHGRWPDEVAGQGFLAQTGVLVFAGWISLAPAISRVLDEL